jgi:hypothetical protein
MSDKREQEAKRAARPQAKELNIQVSEEYL